MATDAQNGNEVIGVEEYVYDDSSHELSNEETVRLLQRLFSGEINQVPSEFDFTQVIPMITAAAQTLAADRFTECFDRPESRPWNFNIYLAIQWFLGVVFRTIFLFPVRFLFCFAMLGFVCLGIGICKLLPFKTQGAERWFISVLIQAVLVSTSAVIQLHGQPPVRAPGQIFVANHTSPLDWLFLSGAVRQFAAIGQKQHGFFGFLQKHVLPPLQCLWFSRDDQKDRAHVTDAMRKRAFNVNEPPLLIFPEGVCVNNQYAIMFKRGVFSVPDVVICPIALRYNFLFSSPYWTSATQSFFGFVCHLFWQWAVVLDVYFLSPMKALPGENAGAFASRTRKAIATAAGLKIRDFDGYFKHCKPSERYSEARRRQFAASLLLDGRPLVETGDIDTPLPPLGPRTALGRHEEVMAEEPNGELQRAASAALIEVLETVPDSEIPPAFTKAILQRTVRSRASSPSRASDPPSPASATAGDRDSPRQTARKR